MCGHVALSWPEIRALTHLHGLADKYFCRVCDEWHPLFKEATAAEAVGIVIEPLPDMPPY